MWAFWNSPAKFNILDKGRRLGASHNLANCTILDCLADTVRILWGDVQHANIIKYYDTFWYPILATLPPGSYSWNQQLKQLRTINKNTRDLKSNKASIIDFRSADADRLTWEGFGYNKIILNEDGIILQDDDLYTKTILPMLLDFPDSKLYSIGVPKGKYNRNGKEHRKYTLSKLGNSGDPRYKTFHATSYESPVASKEDVDLLVDDLGGPNSMMSRQEVMGEYVDAALSPFFHEWNSGYHIREVPYNIQLPVYCSFDFNVQSSCTVWQHNGDMIYCIDEYHERGIDTICTKLLEKYPAHQIRINGDASGSNDNAGNYTFYQTIHDSLGIDWGLFNVPKANPRHKSSWELCNKILKKLTIYISPRCTGLIRDFEKMEVMQGKGEIAIDKTDQSIGHLGDTARYHLHAEHLNSAA
jgi:hypothetical protein